MPNDTAVILTVEGGVPIYRSNCDLYLPEPITLKYGLPIPVSLVPRLLWFTGVALHGEQAEHAQQRHELAGVMVGGASAAEPDPVPAQAEADAVGASADSDAATNGNPTDVEVVGDTADEDTEAGHDAVGGGPDSTFHWTSHTKGSRFKGRGYIHKAPPAAQTFQQVL